MPAGLLGLKFNKLLTKVMRSASTFKRGTINAVEWLQNQAKQMKVADQQIFTTQAFNPRKHTLIPVSSLGPLQIGRMVLFQYQALDADKRLPYWDALPLVFPIEFNLKSKNGRAFYGLNVHYLPLDLRARLLDALYLEYRHGHLDPRKRIQIDYDILKSTEKLKYFKPCFKKYLYSRVRSKFNVIPPLDDDGKDLWAYTLFLPLQQWQKGGTKSKVYADSRRRIRGR